MKKKNCSTETLNLKFPLSTAAFLAYSEIGRLFPMADTGLLAIVSYLQVSQTNNFFHRTVHALEIFPQKERRNCRKMKKTDDVGLDDGTDEDQNLI